MGHVVGPNGIEPEAIKLDRIRQWARPQTGIELASFLGLCNYYRALVPHFAHHTDPLYKLSRSAEIDWSPDLVDSLEQLKRCLLDRPIIQLPNPHLDFILETDASKIAVGAVLKQRFADTGLEHPVSFFSRALTTTERNYSSYELEMYAVVRAVECFRVYLLGKPFLLRTDHAALGNLLKRDIPPTTRISRWILRLSEYVFTIEYLKGSANVIADVLSRLPFASATEKDSANGFADPLTRRTHLADQERDSAN